MEQSEWLTLLQYKNNSQLVLSQKESQIDLKSPGFLPDGDHQVLDYQITTPAICSTLHQVVDIFHSSKISQKFYSFDFQTNKNNFLSGTVVY
jgi:hypothetical protein